MSDEERRQLGIEQVGVPRFGELTKRMGNDGWLGVGWPVEYGGQGRPIQDQYVFFDELRRPGLLFPFVTINTVGPTLMAAGTPEQKVKYLSGMLSGDVVFAIGYTEPEAGTDLASLRTRAVPDGNDWIINGAKVFTTGANTADYVWLACRTDPAAPKHRGVSIFIVPTSSPGFSWTPINLVGGNITTATSYPDVRIPADHLVGELNGGWQPIPTQPNHERIGLAANGGRMIALWEQVLAWTRRTGVIGLAWVQQDMARAAALLEALRLINWKMTWAGARDGLQGAQAAPAKVFRTETHVDVQLILLSVLASAGRCRSGTASHSLAR